MIPAPVEIIRPDLTGREILKQLLGGVLFAFSRAWLVMILLPSLVDFRPGFWRVLIALVILDWTLTDRSYLAWTRVRR